MKKIVLLIVSVMVLMNVMPVSADDNVSVEKRKLDNGNVEVVLQIKEELNACGGSVVYQYDNKAMKLTDTRVLDDENYLFVVNDNYQNTNNAIKVVFASAKPLAGNLMVLVFEPLADQEISKDDITIDSFELSDQAGTVMPDYTKDQIAVKDTKGKSLIDKKTMKPYTQEGTGNNGQDLEDNEQSNDEKTGQESTKKENSTETDIDETSNTEVYIIIGCIILIGIGFVVFKKRVKNK